MNRFLAVMLVFVSVLVACGRRTPPRPERVTPTFEKLEAIQRGESIRLSWTMQAPIPLETNSQQFFIEELMLDPQCVRCEAKQVKQYSLPFPSHHFNLSGKRVSFHPDVHKGLESYIYKVTHQTKNGDALGKTQVIQFTGFVGFPPLPNLHWKRIAKKLLPELRNIPNTPLPTQIKNYKLIRLSWKQQPEKLEFYFSVPQDMVQRTLFYRMNIYKTEQGQPWSDQPVNAHPIKEAFYIDYLPQEEHTFLYKLRLVDSQGNESTPSTIYSIPTK
ncbi:MAG: hypothetical protein HQM14_16365 [SAR324 cluster bacterium]|nr:hypothetical protein [SAR324 cluster bacterium]